MISQFVLFFSLLSCCIQMVGADSLSNALFPAAKKAIDDDNVEFFKTLNMDSIRSLVEYLQTQKKIALEEHARFISIPVCRGLKPCNVPTSVYDEGFDVQQAFWEHYLSRLSNVWQEKKREQKSVLQIFLAAGHCRRNVEIANILHQLLAVSE